jgi:hypothetical protein
MAMPETTVDEDRESKPSDINVRLAGQVLAVKAISHATMTQFTT